MSLESELSARQRDGIERVTTAELDRRLAAIGYEREPGSACRSTHKWMTGERAGDTYPGCSWGVREMDTKRSAFNIESRRDASFRSLQALRQSDVYAVVDGYITGV